MTDRNPGDDYTGPPPTERYAPPTYPTEQYPAPQYPYPGQYPTAPYPGQYPPTYGAPYGQIPPPGYGYPYPAYPAAPTGPKRPGLALAAAILGYINSGLLILSGLFLLLGGAILSDLEDLADTDTDYGTEFAVAGVVNFIAAGLLIAGSVMLAGRNPVGRILFSVANGIVLAESVYWLVRYDGTSFSDASDSYVFWAIVFAGLAVVPLAFAWVGDVSRWLAEEPGPR